MQFLRKFALGLALFLITPLLLILPVFVSLNATIIQPTFVKQTLVKADLYMALSSFITEQASKSTDVASNPIVKTSLEQVVTPTALQQIVEPAIDSTYKWLNNPDSKFDLSVSLEPLKKAFNQALEQNLQTKLTSLPTCKSSTITSADPYNLDCIPKGSDVQQLLKQAQSNNQNIFGDQQSIPLSESQEAPKTPEAPAQPSIKEQSPKFNNNQLKLYAKVYHWVKVGTPVVIGLTVLSALAIMLLSAPKYKGVRRMGVFLLTCGLLLLITTVITNFGLHTFLPVPATEGTLGTAGIKVADAIAKQVTSINRTFTFIYIGSGIVLIITGIVLGKIFKGKQPPAEPIEKENMLPDDDKALEDKKPEPKPEAKEKPAEPIQEPAKEPEAPKEEKKSTKVAVS